MLIDDLKEDGCGRGGRERAELPGDRPAHSHLHIAHRCVFTVGRDARTNSAVKFRKDCTGGPRYSRLSLIAGQKTGENREYQGKNKILSLKRD